MGASPSKVADTFSASTGADGTTQKGTGFADVPLPPKSGTSVRARTGRGEAEREGLRVLLCVCDLRCERDADGDADAELDTDAEAVPVCDGVAESDGVTVRVGLEEVVEVWLGESVARGLLVSLAVALSVGVRVVEPVCELVGVND